VDAATRIAEIAPVLNGVERKALQQILDAATD
jgi:hypothetical protein